MKNDSASNKRKPTSHRDKHTALHIGRQRSFNGLKHICWIIIPVIAIVFIILDALGIYTFNKERLLVLGICLMVILLPFFSEITIKNLSIKRSEEGSDANT